MRLNVSKQRMQDDTDRQLAAVTVQLTAKQVANRLAISTKTLSRWVAAGKFPQPRKLGDRSLRWSAESVAEFLKGLGPDANQ